MKCFCDDCGEIFDWDDLLEDSSEEDQDGDLVVGCPNCEESNLVEMDD